MLERGSGKAGCDGEEVRQSESMPYGACTRSEGVHEALTKYIYAWTSHKEMIVPVSDANHSDAAVDCGRYTNHM